MSADDAGQVVQLGRVQRCAWCGKAWPSRARLVTAPASMLPMIADLLMVPTHELHAGIPVCRSVRACIRRRRAARG